eukprot:g3343.t1
MMVLFVRFFWSALVLGLLRLSVVVGIISAERLELGMPNEISAKFHEQYLHDSLKNVAAAGERGSGNRKGKMRVCLVVASLPWRFGPYQNQGWKLSVSLDRLGFDVEWLAFSSAHAIKKGTYKTSEELFRSHPHLDLPPDDFQDEHLTYLGFNVDGQIATGDSSLSVRLLNRIAKVYKIQRYIILTDTTRISRDVSFFRIPAVMWLPHHHATLTNVDKYTLDAFALVAALNPTVASLFPAERISRVAYIPHIVETPKLDPLFASRTFHGIPEDAFVVLAQGGNYEMYDRKGWVQLLQSFAIFLAKQPNAFLYIHAIGKRSISALEHGGEPPPALTNDGPNLYDILTFLDVPDTAYKLDTSVHDFEEAVALKKMADVCLHPSKTEGFGLNILECQILGTPVVTTKFLAMADFTRNGVSVPPAQYELVNSGFVATPDVHGCARALLDVANEDAIVSSQKSTDAAEWIKDHFSSKRVGNAFASHLVRLRRHAVGNTGADHVDVLTGSSLSIKPWTVVHSPDVEVATIFLEQLLESKLPLDDVPEISMLPINGVKTLDPKFVQKDSDLPFAVLIRTLHYVQASTFFENSRMRLGWAISRVGTGAIGTLPSGLAKVIRRKRRGEARSHHKKWAEWEL